MEKVLTIAGSDCSGGAGVQADIKTITAHKLYAMSAITALTAQNTTGVYGIMDVTEEFLIKELECIFEDIFPDAVKIGMVSSTGLIKVIAEQLKRYHAQNIVLDPVMVSTSGSRLLAEEAEQFLIEYLLPVATVVTPNIPEAEVLSGRKIVTADDMIRAAEIISQKCNGAVLIKGGHCQENANDLLYENGSVAWYLGARVNNPNTHGTGCTLSSAIASNLAKGDPLRISVEKAKKYVEGALKANLDLGKGSGPLNHMFQI